MNRALETGRINTKVYFIMRQIQTFWPGRLTNAAHGQYITSLLALMDEQTTCENEKFKAAVAALKAAYAEEDKAFVISQKSELTAVMEVADAQQDNGVNGLRALIAAAKYDEAKKEAAQKLEDAIRPYKLDTREQMAQEAYKVAQCAAALEEEAMKPHVTAIGATQFVAQMKQGATALQAAMLQRNEERAALTPEALANARLKTDEALKELLFVADAVITMFGEETLPALAAKVNELVRYTKQHMVNQPKPSEGDKNPAPAPEGGEGGGADKNPATGDGGSGSTGGGVVTPVQPA